MIKEHLDPERRQHKRVPVKLKGRYMLADRSEHDCVTIDASPGGLLVRALACPHRGQRVIVYLEELGRIEGIAKRIFKGGFAMSIIATSRKREKFTSSLTWLSNCEELGMTDKRRSARKIPARTQTALTLTNGQSLPALIEDFSTTGARVKVNAELADGSIIIIGKRAARVSRKTETGYAVELNVPLTSEEFSRYFEF